MYDDNWDVTNGPVAHEIEVANQASQVNFIEAWVRCFTHHGVADPFAEIDVCSITRELHRRGTLFLLKRCGLYREENVELRDHLCVHYRPPDWQRVESLMEEFNRDIYNRWQAQSPIALASYILWRLNWIHPFKNGNGRTARALAYACLCLKYGLWLPGFPTVIDLISNNKPEFEAALRAGDASFAQSGSADLNLMVAFVERLFRIQMESAGLTQAASEMSRR